MTPRDTSDVTGSAGPALAPLRPIALPWGPHDTLNLNWPTKWPAPDVFMPRLEGSAADYPRALSAALDAPLDSEPIDQLAGRGTRVAIVVDDPSRWTPVAEALPVILDRLHATGVLAGNIDICIGVGRHRAVDRDGMRRRLGDDVVARYRCHSPPVDKQSEYVELGTTDDGVPVRVYRPVAEASLCVLVGSVLPHLQAGYGGGDKLIFPGCSHRSTLGALHRRGLDGDHDAAARLLGGDVAKNPMRRSIRAAARLLPAHRFSISHVMGGSGQVLCVAAGAIDAVQERLSAEVARRFRACVGDPSDVVVVGNYPWPGDPLMSFKVLLNHRAAARQGGVLAGLFWADPAEIDRSMPKAMLKLIAGSGSLGGWAVRRGLRVAEGLTAVLRHPSRFMLRWARELVADRAVVVYCPPLVEAVGPRLGPVRLVARLDEFWPTIESALKGLPVSARFFGYGGLTFVAPGS